VASTRVGQKLTVRLQRQESESSVLSFSFYRWVYVYIMFHTVRIWFGSLSGCFVGLGVQYRQSDNKRRPLPYGRFHHDFAAVIGDRMFDDTQAKTGTTGST